MILKLIAIFFTILTIVSLSLVVYNFVLLKNDEDGPNSNKTEHVVWVWISFITFILSFLSATGSIAISTLMTHVKNDSNTFLWYFVHLLPNIIVMVILIASIILVSVEINISDKAEKDRKEKSEYNKTLKGIMVGIIWAIVSAVLSTGGTWLFLLIKRKSPV